VEILKVTVSHLHRKYTLELTVCSGIPGMDGVVISHLIEWVVDPIQRSHCLDNAGSS
jgi:hypothetical protein